MGGMHGFGRVEAEPNEPPFHERWEGRAGGIVETMSFPPGFPGDRFRYLRETLRPDLYLTQSYYEQWLYVAEQILLEAGMISAQELRDGRPAAGEAKRNDAMRRDVVWDYLHDRTHTGRKLEQGPCFAIDQRIRARNMQPEGHTRLPRYARGKIGTVTRHHGGHVLPDAHAHWQGPAPQHLYTVRFTARELWGEAANARDTIHLDLWESYLEPA
jgi:nitrile hydratase